MDIIIIDSLHIKGKHCDKADDDPCVTTPSPCQHGMCHKIDETNFSCICDDGYTGQLCDTDQDQQTTSTDISEEEDEVQDDDDIEHSLCDPSPCYPGVTCSHQDWYFTCGPCPPGLTGDGITCHTCSYNDVTCGHVSLRGFHSVRFSEEHEEDIAVKS